MSRVLELLLEGQPLSTPQMADILGMTVPEIEAELDELKRENVFLGWRPVLQPNASGDNMVRALIEVKITPERVGGFDRIAERIARFTEVETCYLMSGAYDLLLVVHGDNLQSVARFVSVRLASINGVLSTATHFMLCAYKEQGFLFERDKRDPDKPSVSP